MHKHDCMQSHCAENDEDAKQKKLSVKENNSL